MIVEYQPRQAEAFIPSSRAKKVKWFNRRTFGKDDAALTYSHDDKCFYVVEVTGARAGPA